MHASKPSPAVLQAVFFARSQDFREWLQQHSATEQELIVGYYKMGSGRPSMTWSESVDQALCFGWIDGVRRTIDGESYCIRFTPRKPKSIWSAVNIQKVAELTAQGLMQPAGLAAFALRKEDRSAVYAYERTPAELSPAYEAELRANPQAWQWLEAVAPSYRRSAIAWVMGGKQEATRQKRLQQLIADSAAGLRLKQYRY